MGWLDIALNALVQYAGRPRSPEPPRQFQTLNAFARANGLGIYGPGAAAPATEGSQYMAGIGFIPPGGAAGFAQMTSASKLALTGGRTARRKRRKRKSASGRLTMVKGPKSRRIGSGRLTMVKGPKSRRIGKLKKGSAAAKRRMAKLRAMRK